MWLISASAGVVRREGLQRQMKVIFQAYKGIKAYTEHIPKLRIKKEIAIVELRTSVKLRTMIKISMLH